MKYSNEQNSNKTERRYYARRLKMVALEKLEWLSGGFVLYKGDSAYCFYDETKEIYCLFKWAGNGWCHMSKTNLDKRFYIIEEEFDITNYGVF